MGLPFSYPIEAIVLFTAHIQALQLPFRLLPVFCKKIQYRLTQEKHIHCFHLDYAFFPLSNFPLFQSLKSGICAKISEKAYST